MEQASISLSGVSRVFEISLRSVPVNCLLPIDIYIEVAGKLTLLRRAGDVFTGDRIQGLHDYHVKQVYAPVEQRQTYKDFLWNLVVSSPPDDPHRILSISESAHIQIDELAEATEMRSAIEATLSFLRRFCDLSSSDASVLPTLISLINPTDRRQCQHAFNTCLYSMVLANHLSAGNGEAILEAAVVGLIHDVGEDQFGAKLAENPDRMTVAEWERYKQHPNQSLSNIEAICGISKNVEIAIAQHHEYLDGSGFPNGLSADQVSMLARLVTISDTFETLIASHARSNSPLEEALGVMQSVRPERFDQSMLRVFVGTMEAFCKSRRERLHSNPAESRRR